MSDQGLPEEPPLTPEAAYALTVTRTQWYPLASVLAVVALGLILSLFNFRYGALVLCAAVLMAFTMRAAMPEEDVGILAVRAKRWDLAVLGVLAVGLGVLALIVPII